MRAENTYVRPLFVPRLNTRPYVYLVVLNAASLRQDTAVTVIYSTYLRAVFLQVFAFDGYRRLGRSHPYALTLDAGGI